MFLILFKCEHSLRVESRRDFLNMSDQILYIYLIMEVAFRYLKLTYQEPHRNLIYLHEYIKLLIYYCLYIFTVWLVSEVSHAIYDLKNKKECHELFYVVSSKVLADHFLQEQMYLQYRRISVWYKISVGRIPGHRGRSPKGPGAVVPCRILQLGLDPQAFLIII